MLVGNDIVDLREAAAAGKERDQRFVERVFSKAEQATIRQAANPTLTLWMLWAAKESLFKIASKLEPGLIFAHAEFALKSVQRRKVLAASSPEGSLVLPVLYKHYQMQLQWEWNAGFVHCMAAWGGEWEARVAILGENREGKLSAREEESVHSQESREVRHLVKAMIRKNHSLKNAEVIRPTRQQPPAIQVNGKPVLGVDLSLSHDGGFVAAMISL